MKKWLILTALLFTTCAGPVHQLYPAKEADRPIPVYIVSHGWHVGIAFESVYIKPFLPPHEKFPNSRYLKFGWGDRNYYPNGDAGTWLVLRAALIPTRSVIHVVGIRRSVNDYFPASTIVKVMVSKRGVEEMSKYIADQFEIKNDSIQIAAEGLYPNSMFFEAKERYYFPKTSNRWTAKVLRKSGYPISPFYAITSGNVVKQSSRHGKIIQKR